MTRGNYVALLALASSAVAAAEAPPDEYVCPAGSAGCGPALHDQVLMQLNTRMANQKRQKEEAVDAGAQGQDKYLEPIPFVPGETQIGDQKCGESPWKGMIAQKGGFDNFAAALNKGSADRARYPSTVRQRNTMFCGPASVLHALAFAMPNTYQEMIYNLACRGYYKGARYTAHPISKTIAEYLWADGILEFNPDDNGFATDPVDWLGMASLVDTENLLSPPTEAFAIKNWGVPSTSQLSTPGFMSNWVKLMLPSGMIKSYGSWWHPFSEMAADSWREIRKTVGDITNVDDNGENMAMLLVKWKDSSIPNHWVVMHRSNDEDYCLVWTYGLYIDFDCDELRKMTVFATTLDIAKGGIEVPLSHREALLAKCTWDAFKTFGYRQCV